jgi:hypothetical protein
MIRWRNGGANTGQRRLRISCPREVCYERRTGLMLAYTVGRVRARLGRGDKRSQVPLRTSSDIGYACANSPPHGFCGLVFWRRTTPFHSIYQLSLCIGVEGWCIILCARWRSELHRLVAIARFGSLGLGRRCDLRRIGRRCGFGSAAIIVDHFDVGWQSA